MTGQAEGGVDEVAASWCVRLQDGALDRSERALLKAWVDQDVTNRQALIRMMRLWTDLGAGADTPGMLGLRSGALDWLRRKNGLPRIAGSAGRSPRRFLWLGIAAALIMAIAVGMITGAGGRDTVIETGLGERRLVMLPDGSRVSLDGASRVSYRFEAAHRRLRLLAGRAKFDVAKDATRPFTVSSGGRTVIATGTSFSVEHLSAQIRVILYEGRVSVVEDGSDGAAPLSRLRSGRGAPPARLLPGREFVAIDGRPGSRQAAADLDRSLSWETGFLDFHDEPLALAAERMNRYSRNPLIIGDEQLGRLRVNGVFHADDAEAFVSSLAALYGFAYARDGNAIRLTAKRTAAPAGM